jgi:hypothetical protein
VYAKFARYHTSYSVEGWSEQQTDKPLVEGNNYKNQIEIVICMIEAIRLEMVQQPHPVIQISSCKISIFKG